MIDILNKFDSIKVDNNSRIDSEDREYCITKQEQYNNAINTLNKINEILKEDLNFEVFNDKWHRCDTNNCFLTSYKFRDIQDLPEDIKESFIHYIIEYFVKKYKISIDSYEVAKKYRNKDVDYNILLDEIFLRLGGYSFKEKAIDEIKQAAKTKHQYYKWYKKWSYEVKGKTIKFKINIDKIQPALYFYDNNETEIINYYTHNKVDDYKSYSNGNIDIKFYEAKYALDFAKRYLGYVEMTEDERRKIETAS